MKTDMNLVWLYSQYFIFSTQLAFQVLPNEFYQKYVVKLNFEVITIFNLPISIHLGESS